MNLQLVNQMVLMSNLPSLLIIATLPPAAWLADHGYLPEAAHYLLLPAMVASIPISFIVGPMGILASLQGRISWLARIPLIAINLGAISFGAYAAAQLWMAMSGWKGLGN